MVLGGLSGYLSQSGTGNLVVNGQTFAIGNSPQTVVLTGLTSDGLSVDVTANFDALPGCSLTVTDVFTAPTDCTPTPCGILAITAGTQTACDPLTNEYTQEVTVTFTNPPATANLVVNGQTFAIGTSPQTVVLTGLTSDGLSVDVTANFDADPSCSLTELNLFTAPADCAPTPCGISAITAGTQTACDPLTNEYTQEVTLTFTNPPTTGTWYKTLEKPFFQPPSWLFGPAWTTLYILMGISFARIWQVASKSRYPIIRKYALRGLAFFGFQFVFNLAWTPAFFGLENPTLALVIIFLLLGLIAFLIKHFLRLDRIAAFLLIPYFLWVTFATVLNLSIVVLN